MRKIRSAYRLALTVIFTAGHFWFWQFGRLFVGSSHNRQLRWRNKCVGAWARSLGATAGMRITVDGKPPEPPFFLVANHLSYIDIIALSIVTDCVFIAKSEIEGWPGVGFMAKSIGTIFIERSNFQDIPRVISRIEQALDEGKGIILFAEGTSGKGDKVLPFSSALLEPAARLGLPVSHASITYRTPSDEVPAEQAVCWWGDMTMFPHLVELLKVPEFDAAIRFGSEPISDSDRKTLSRRLWQAVSESFVPVGVPAEAFFSKVAPERVPSGSRRWMLLVMMCVTLLSAALPLRPAREPTHHVTRLTPDRISKIAPAMVSNDIASRLPARAGSAYTSFNLSYPPSISPTLITSTSGLKRQQVYSEIVLFVTIAAATLVSEDLTCISAGLMASQRRTGLGFAMLACIVGIFLGDILLYLSGRLLGRAFLSRAPLKWFLDEASVDSASSWLSRRGFAVIFASRFVPGLRLPTYFAAGMLRTSATKFSIYFLAACAVWVPLLVGISSKVGGEVVAAALKRGASLSFGLIAVLALIFVLVRIGTPLLNYRGRRLLLSRWRRLTHWEFWHPWAFYPPVVLHSALLSLRYRSLAVFTAANPAIPAGGFIGESKFQILEGLKGSSENLPATELLKKGEAVADRIDQLNAFLVKNRLDYPVVLKPDAGQRGSGVVIVRSPRAAESYLKQCPLDTIVQEYIPGIEFGIFYYRHPDEDRGRILGITEKRYTSVRGDGRRTLEELILDDDRGLANARAFLKAHRDRLADIPLEGQDVRLVELGTHARGALFLDATKHATPELESAIDNISKSFDGFYFGRFDIKCPTLEDLRSGIHLKIIELNGVTSEATNIYDPANSLVNAYRVLFKQWTLAFAIGRANMDRGFKPAPVSQLLRGAMEYRRNAKQHPAAS